MYSGGVTWQFILSDGITVGRLDAWYIGSQVLFFPSIDMHPQKSPNCNLADPYIPLLFQELCQLALVSPWVLAVVYEDAVDGGTKHDTRTAHAQAVWIKKCAISL